MQKQWEIKVVRCINEWASFSCQWNGTKSTTWKSHARHCNEFSNHQPHTHTRVHHMLKNHLCRSFYKRLAAILHSRRAAALLPLFFFFSQKHLRCLGSRLVALAARERYGSDERVDRGETVGHSLGRGPWGGNGWNRRLGGRRGSSPRDISHGFPSVRPVVASISLLPHGALPKLFPMASPPSTSISLLRTGALPKLFPMLSPPSTLSSLPSRSFPAELSPSYFPRFHFAPSQRSSPHVISHRFPSIHSVTLSSLPYRPFPTELSRSYFPRDFLSVHLVVASLSLLLSPCYFPRFPVRPPCHHFHIAPSQRKRRQGGGKGK